MASPVLRDSVPKRPSILCENVDLHILWTQGILTKSHSSFRDNSNGPKLWGLPYLSYFQPEFMSSFPVCLGVIYASVCPSFPFSNLPFLFPPLSPFFPPYIPPSIQPSPSIQGTSYLFWSDRGELMSHFSLYFSLIMDGFHSLLIGLSAICVSFYVNCMFFFPLPIFLLGSSFFFNLGTLVY